MYKIIYHIYNNLTVSNIKFSKMFIYIYIYIYIYISIINDLHRLHGYGNIYSMVTYKKLWKKKI
jgi:hypothetical protein